MIAGLDSAFPPSPAQIQVAVTNGVKIWGGYIATQPNVGLYHVWSQADFDVVRACGSIPIAYCSGWDDPVALRKLAAAWNVRLCLDVESGIRQLKAQSTFIKLRRTLGLPVPRIMRTAALSTWIQPWLNASGAGIYGNYIEHNSTAAFHVLSYWPGYDPQNTWIGAPPNTPHGLQWQGGHQEFGVNVDRCWFDDWFKSTYGPSPGEIDMTPDEHAYLYALGWRVAQLCGDDPSTWPAEFQGYALPVYNPVIPGPAYPSISGINQKLDDLLIKVGNIKGIPGPAGATGLQGLSGSKGDPGAAGPSGSTGKDGVPGKDAPFPTDTQVQTGILAIIKRLLGI